jgi:hypothetical protein
MNLNCLLNNSQCNKAHPNVTVCNINIFVTELNIYFYIFSLRKNKPRKRGLFESFLIYFCEFLIALTNVCLALPEPARSASLAKAMAFSMSPELTAF